MNTRQNAIEPLPASGLFALLAKWDNRVANFRAYAGEHDLAKHKIGISEGMRKHEERCEKHLYACCRMIEDCSQELRAVIGQANT